MKTIMLKSLTTMTVLALCLTAFAQEPESAAPAATETETAASPTSGTDTNAENMVDQQTVGELIQAVVEAQAGAGEKTGENEKTGESGTARRIRGEGSRGSRGTSTNTQSLASLLTNSPSATNGKMEKMLRLNFRDASLSLVLDYLSEAAGFTISADSKVDMRGKITVWSNTPVDRDGAIRILNQALVSNNCGADVEGNMLHIYVVDATTSPIIAGVPGNEYTNVPPTKELVTQVVYVKNVESAQLISALQPLMPPGTSMSSFQGANAIVLTDTKSNIRRMLQLVKAFDTPTVSSAMVRVFPLQYADATQLAQVVQQLFTADTSGSGQGGRRFGGFFGGGGGPFGGGGFGGGGGDRGGGGNSSTPAGRVAAPKVTAVADDRSNSLVVSAAEDQMDLIANLVDQMDVGVDDVTELRVFRLRHADPQETADQLTSLFPDSTNTQGNRNQQFQFGGRFGGFFGGGNQNASSTGNQSQRKLKQTRVTAVPDPRTSSVIVSAGREMMKQIGDIIEELDSDPSHKKKVYVIKVENRDPADVVEDLQSVIASDTSGGNFNNTRSSSTRQTGSQLNARGQNNLQNQGTSSGLTGFGTGNTGGRTGTGR